jgi:hypothetical protein
MLHENLNVLEMYKLCIGAWGCNFIVGLPVGRCVGKAHCVRRRRVRGAGEIGGVVVVEIWVHAPVYRRQELEIGKNLIRSVRIDVAQPNQSAEIVVIGVVGVVVKVVVRG